MICPRSTVGGHACENYKPANRCADCPIRDQHRCEGCKKVIAANVLPAQVALILHGHTLADSVARDNVLRFCTIACLGGWCKTRTP